ncbi:phosphotransferase [Nonomuraea sp. SMC257]|uniref:Phosphotransferase n=1 Tax=Nonomuraea montanisoli TaxID=2741721 RepID=A0A7Y6M8I1_9ACTN|nr:phosphotransferase [Nonomuraea montanisoli]NUW37429.1 phosphotransferase [Nonomuraea montanisoli]
MKDRLPPAVLDELLGRPGGSLVSCESEPITGSSGAATGAVTRLSGTARLDDRHVRFAVIHKSCEPPTGGRHAAGAADPRHWANWRREPLAYSSGLLPSGPGLAAPRCYGVIGDSVYLADVGATPESPSTAAYRLGRWQAGTATPDLPWLSGHQLAQRIAVSDLNWTGLDVHPRIPALWERRGELLERLSRLPHVLVHGDFSRGNLRASEDGLTTLVLDWATLGTGPVGADLASLALTAPGHHLHHYVDGLNGRFTTIDVALGYRATLALTGAGRIHWMLTQGITPSDGYTDFVLTETSSL